MNKVPSTQNLSTKASLQAPSTDRKLIENGTNDGGMEQGNKVVMSWNEKICQLNDKIIFEALHDNDHKSAKILLQQLLLLVEREEHKETKKYYFYQIYVVYYNKAYLSHQIDKLDDCHRYLQKAIQSFQLMLAYAKNRQESVAFNLQYVQLLLQLCAVMSQNGKHGTAVSLAEKSLNKLIQSFRILSAICYEHKLLNSEPETKQSSLQSESNRPDRVDFKRIVIKEATKRLGQLSNLPSIHKLILEDKDHYEGIIKNIYFWKDNTENNEKILRKQFEADKGMISPRNILGVQKKQSWVQTFHIGTLMCLKPKKMHHQINSDTFHLLSTQFLLQATIYCSVCYFTIATETRFNQFEQDPQSVSISEKYKRLHANQTMKRCKLIHIKALEIATKYLPPSNFFLSHLLSSFNKNYKFLLDQIGEESEILKEGKLGEVGEDVSEYGIAKPEAKMPIERKTRKRSKTNDKLKKRIQSKGKQGN